jgi:hypothetical protein
MGLAFFEIEDRHAKLLVRRIERNKLACMGKRGGEIAGIPRDRDEGKKRVPIRRVTFVGIFEQLHRRCTRANGIQRDRVDIGIARIVGRKLAGLPQFRKCTTTLS